MPITPGLRLLTQKDRQLKHGLGYSKSVRSPVPVLFSKLNGKGKCVFRKLLRRTWN